MPNNWIKDGPRFTRKHYTDDTPPPSVKKACELYDQFLHECKQLGVTPLHNGAVFRNHTLSFKWDEKTTPGDTGRDKPEPLEHYLDPQPSPPPQVLSTPAPKTRSLTNSKLRQQLLHYGNHLLGCAAHRSNRRDHISGEVHPTLECDCGWIEIESTLPPSPTAEITETIRTASAYLPLLFWTIENNQVCVHTAYAIVSSGLKVYGHTISDQVQDIIHWDNVYFSLEEPTKIVAKQNKKLTQLNQTLEHFDAQVDPRMIPPCTCNESPKPCARCDSTSLPMFPWDHNDPEDQ